MFHSSFSFSFLRFLLLLQKCKKRFDSFNDFQFLFAIRTNVVHTAGFPCAILTVVLGVYWARQSPLSSVFSDILTVVEFFFFAIQANGFFALQFTRKPVGVFLAHSFTTGSSLGSDAISTRCHLFPLLLSLVHLPRCGRYRP